MKRDYFPAMTVAAIALAVLTSCGKKFEEPAPPQKTAQQETQEAVVDVTSPDGVKCVVYRYRAISCNWNEKK